MNKGSVDMLNIAQLFLQLILITIRLSPYSNKYIYPHSFVIISICNQVSHCINMFPFSYLNYTPFISNESKIIYNFYEQFNTLFK